MNVQTRASIYHRAFHPQRLFLERHATASRLTNRPAPFRVPGSRTVKANSHSFTLNHRDAIFTARRGRPAGLGASLFHLVSPVASVTAFSGLCGRARVPPLQEALEGHGTLRRAGTGKSLLRHISLGGGQRVKINGPLLHQEAAYTTISSVYSRGSSILLLKFHGPTMCMGCSQTERSSRNVDILRGKGD